ncbi:hypothetical protein [uncultured Cohaesibacter sp.]|uniref:hypothetical protein n=1 Tax=uncultured Cohaesibacter sp. TaxID=1002546 RepID=UPI0029C768EF|nr:hypothetical protein [uncultured Cohaesibacter sp.]
MTRQTNNKVILSNVLLIAVFLFLVLYGDDLGLQAFAGTMVPLFILSIFASLVYGLFARFGSWIYHSLLTDPHWRKSVVMNKQTKQMRYFKSIGIYVQASTPEVRQLAERYLKD